MNEKSNEEIWREEFCKFNCCSPLEIDFDDKLKFARSNYLAGRKAGQEEIDLLKSAGSVLRYSHEQFQKACEEHLQTIAALRAELKDVKEKSKYADGMLELNRELRAENEKLSDEKFKVNCHYLDLVELVRYHSPSTYDKIFSNEKVSNIKLMVDREVTILLEGEKDKQLEALKLENERLSEIVNTRDGAFSLAHKEIRRLKSLVERAKPYMLKAKYAAAIDHKQDLTELIQWQIDDEKEGVK